MHTYGEVVVIKKKMVFFTEHQIKIAQLTADDKRIGEIAKELKTSESNIQTILNKMRAKIAVKHVPALLVYLYSKNAIQ